MVLLAYRPGKYASLFVELPKIQLKEKTLVHKSTWGNIGRGPGEFRNPYGIALGNEGKHIYVSDCLNGTIKKYDYKGKLLNEWGSYGEAKGQLKYPADLAMDSRGLLYVSEEVNHRIQVFDSNGKSVRIIGKKGGKPGEFNSPLGLAIDKEDILYVVDYLNRRIQKMNVNGKVLMDF